MDSMIGSNLIFTGALGGFRVIEDLAWLAVKGGAVEVGEVVDQSLWSDLGPVIVAQLFEEALAWVAGSETV